MKRIITENFIYNGLNSICTFITGVVLSIILARLLGPADYGSYNLIVWVLGVVSLIALMGFPNSVEKYVSEYDGRQDKDALRKIISFVLNIEILWGILVTVLFIALANKLSLWLKHPEFRTLFWVASLIIIPGAVNAILASASRGLQIFKNVMIVNIITLPLSLGFIFFALSKGAGVVGILWVQLGITLVSILIFCILLRKVFSLRGGKNLVSAIKKKVLNFNFTLLAILLLDSIVWRRSEVFFLTLFRTPEEVGYYGLAFGVAAMSVRFIPEAFGSVIGPVLSNRYGAQDRAGLHQVFTKSAKYLMLMTVPICMAMVTVANPLIELVYGKSYLPAAGILPMLVISSGLGVIAYAASGLVYGTEKQNIVLVIVSLAAALNLTMDVLLIPRYGIYGATAANSLAQGVAFFLGFSYVHYKMKVRFPLGFFTKTILAGVVAFGVIYSAMAICGKSLLNLILLLITGEGIYLLIICLTQRQEIKELKDYFYEYSKRKVRS